MKYGTNKINTILKTKIVESGQRQNLFAWKLEISETVLSKIIQGWIEPDNRLKKRIAKALRCPVEEIFPPEVEEEILPF